MLLDCRFLYLFHLSLGQTAHSGKLYIVDNKTMSISFLRGNTQQGAVGLTITDTKEAQAMSLF